jgi:AcrR family transcriptional regulator
VPKVQAKQIPPMAGGPRSRRGEQTRAKLVKAAKEIFERDGFLDARIVDIAARAKVSYGAFYHYFDSKEQIFREVAEAQESRLTAPPDLGEPRIADPTPYDRIHQANRRYLQRYRDEAKLMGVIEQVSRYDSYVNHIRIASYRHFADRFEQALRQWQKEGAADRRVDPTTAADALGSMIGRLAELWLTQGYREYDFDQAVDQITLLWANAVGVSVPDAKKRASRRKAN